MNFSFNTDYNPGKKLSEMTFCAIDLETTGISAAMHEIVEIGMIRFSLKGEVETFQALVNPGVNIPPETTAIHGITDSMVEQSPPISAFMDRIASMIDGALLVIQNPGFDMSFLFRAMEDNGYDCSGFRAVDTVRLARAAYPGLGNYRLDTVCSHIGREVADHHRAFCDTEGCHDIFRDVLRLKDPGCRWTLADLTAFHGKLLAPRLKADLRRSGRVMPGLTVGQPAVIKYRDSSGNVTVRKIIPRKIVSDGKKEYIVAFCHLRGGERLFNTGRIESVM